MDESRDHLLAEIERLKRELARERAERWQLDEVRAELAREERQRERERADRADLERVRRILSE